MNRKLRIKNTQSSCKISKWKKNLTVKKRLRERLKSKRDKGISPLLPKWWLRAKPSWRNTNSLRWEWRLKVMSSLGDPAKPTIKIFKCSRRNSVSKTQKWKTNLSFITALTRIKPTVLWINHQPKRLLHPRNNKFH